MLPIVATPSALTILHQDEDLVAVHKPAGLLVHRSSLDAHESITALDLLRTQLGQPLWPLHRLDKATSGVLLFALNEEAASRSGRAFSLGEVRKRYIALVRGWPAESGFIDYPLARDPELPSAGQPRLPAFTRWWRRSCMEWPIPTDPRHPGTRVALLEIAPETGRRHQIRRHMKHIAHPIVGDSTHGKGPLNRAAAAYLGVRRLWLHALEIEWGGLRIRSPLGPEWLPLDDAAAEWAEPARPG